MAATRAARLLPVVKETDCYVLFRDPGSARIPQLHAWLIRHHISSGHQATHADLFRRVLVIGQPDGVDLSDRCAVVFVNPEKADTLFFLNPDPDSFFPEV